MPVSLQEAVASRTLQSMEDLISAAERVPADKVEWHPIGDSRTVLDIVQECGRVNDRWADMLASGQWIAWSEEKIEQIKAETANLPAAVAYLREATQKYTKAVREMPDSRLDEDFASPWMTTKVSNWLMHALWHMSYHEGQVQYIQTLYGDWGYGD